MPDSSRIAIESLSKLYPRARAPALSDVTLRIEPGEIFGLIGPNGAGKTTLIGCLLGLLFPTKGSIRIEGRPPDDLDIRRVTGYLPERLQFDRWMTGRSFMTLHHRLAGLAARRRQTDVAMALERVGLEPARWDTAIKRYSRGMLQRLGMAQALLGEPRFVFLDEPASGVDPAGVLAFRDILMDLKARGVTVLLNSHQLDQLERVCDRVAYIEGGAIRHIEDLRVTEAGRRVLVVRWLRVGGAGEGTDEGPSSAQVTAAVGRAGASVLDLGPDGGRFTVDGDEQAAALLRALADGGCAIVEAASEAGRLEKFFRAEGSRGAAS